MAKCKNLVVFYWNKRDQMKNLEQIRQKSKEIKDKIDNTEERLR